MKRRETGRQRDTDREADREEGKKNACLKGRQGGRETWDIDDRECALMKGGIHYVLKFNHEKFGNHILKVIIF